MAKSTSNERNPSKRDNGNAPIVLKLSQAEAEVVKQACIKYRQTIPIYIEARRKEAKIIDRVLRQLK